MAAKSLAIALAAALLSRGAALLNEVVRPGREKHEPAPSALVATLKSGSNSSSLAYAPAIVCGMTTPVLGASPGSSLGAVAGYTLETCLQSCVSNSACLAIIYHENTNCINIARTYDPLYAYESHYTAYVANKLSGANCETSYDFLFDGCPRAPGMSANFVSDSMKIWECQAACDSDSTCVAFETNGCTNNPNCGGNCYKFLGGDAASIYNENCVTSGDQKSYVKLNWCVRITTGTEGHAGGRLDVTVNGVAEISGDHNVLGAVIMEKCYATSPVVTVHNSHVNNAWLGAVEISTVTGGGSSYVGMICTDCTNGGTDGSDMSVDADADAFASADCLNGETCTLIAPSSPTASPTASPTTESPTASPTASPTTASPTSSPTSSPTTASPTAAPQVMKSVDLIGDPHVTNFVGKRFDIQYAGDLMLLQIPQGGNANATLLRLDGHIKHVGAQCNRQLYLDSLKFSGKWVVERNGADLFFAARRSAADASNPRHKQHFNLGGVHIMMSHAQTDTGITYLNLRISNLSQVHASIGGLLGEDDYSWASDVPAACQGVARGQRHPTVGSVLFASSDSDLGQKF